MSCYQAVQAADDSEVNFCQLHSTEPNGRPHPRTQGPAALHDIKQAEGIEQMYDLCQAHYLPSFRAIYTLRVHAILWL